MPANPKVKATWSGEGSPPSGISEYGAGTPNSVIPLGIYKQRNNPNSNWTFEFVSGEPPATDFHKYMSTPVWFYTDSGQQMYTDRKAYVPKEAEGLTQGTIADVYRQSSTIKRTGKGMMRSQLDEYEKNTEVAKKAELMTKLRDTRVSAYDPKQPVKSAFELNKVLGGGAPILPMYMFALETGNEALMDRIESWVGQRGSLALSSFDFFPNDKNMAEGLKDVNGASMAAKILGADNMTDLNRAIADIYSKVAETQAPTEEDIFSGATPLQPSEQRPLPPEVQQDRPIDIPVPIKQEAPAAVTATKIEFVPEKYVEAGVSTAFSRRYSSEEIDKGQHYIKNIPDGILTESLLQLSPASMSSIKNFMPNFIKKHPLTGEYALAPQSERSFEAPSILSTGETALLIEALGEYEGILQKFNPEFEISSTYGDYSPIFTMNFPYMALLGAGSNIAFAGIQQAFKTSLLNQMMKKDPAAYREQISDLQGVGGSVNLIDIPDRAIIMSAIDDMWSHEYVDGELSSLGKTLSVISNLGAVPKQEVVSKLTSTFKATIENLSFLKSKGGPSQGQFGSKSLYAAGRPMGMLVSNHTSGNKKKGIYTGDSTLMWVAQDDFGSVLSKLIGEKTEIGLGDTIQYVPTTSGSPVSFSLGLMQALHKFLPYHTDANGDLQVEVAGETYNLDRLEGAEKDKVKDALMQDIGSRCNMSTHTPIDSQSALFNVSKKYQGGLYKNAPDIAEDMFGAQKSMEKLKGEDNVHNNTDALRKATEGVSSLINFMFTDIEPFLPGKGSLDPVMEASLGRTRTLEAVMIRKEQEMLANYDEIAVALGVPPEYHDQFEDILGSTMKTMRTKMVTLFKDKEMLASSQVGSFSEYAQILVPLISAMNYHSKRGETLEFEKDSSGNYVHSEIPLSRINGNTEAEQGKSKFMAIPLTFTGYSYKVNGVDNFIVKDKKSSGYGDMLHIQDPTGQAVIHPFEGKTSKNRDFQVPHMKQTSAFLRSVLRTTKHASDIRLGTTSTVHLSYGHGSVASTPLGQIGSGQGRVEFFYPKFGIPRMGKGSNVDYKNYMGVFSQLDGAGLECEGRE